MYKRKRKRTNCFAYSLFLWFFFSFLLFDLYFRSMLSFEWLFAYNNTRLFFSLSLSLVFLWVYREFLFSNHKRQKFCQKMPRLPWKKKYKLLPSSSKKWTIRTTVSFPSLLFDVFSMLALSKHAHWLRQIRTKKRRRKN